MYLYIASSWRNPLYPPLLSMLRTWGHECYDFRENGFSWYEIFPTWDGENVPVEDMAQLFSPLANDGFIQDKTALDKADVLVMCLPCGNSAHAEFGYMVGQNKPTAVLVPYSGKIRPDLMWKFADLVTANTDALRIWLEVHENL